MSTSKQLVNLVKAELVASKQRATSYDVARAAGVSQSAVSRCFKSGASVSKKMRDKVQKVALELGYRPNAIARSLITRRSNMVAVVINNDTNLYYPELLVELSRQFNASGVHMLLFTLEKESDVANVLDQVWQYQVDGVILAAQLKDEQLSFFEERNIPFVYYNRTPENAPCSSVTCDEFEGERLLVNHLVDKDHKKYCIVAGPSDSMVSVKRMRGALQRLSELGIEDVKVVSGDYSYESGVNAIRQLMLEQAWQPDAVICANDTMALGVIDFFRLEKQLSVPKDVSVVGFDGAGPSKWQAYQLTTVAQPLKSMAAAAVELLMQRIDNPEHPPEKRVFSGVFVPGKSSK